MLHITICDDEPAQLQLLENCVREWGKNELTELAIESFGSGEQFLFAWEEKKNTDILLLDIEMPGIDGMALARRLRSAGETLQIIFVTGNTEYVFLGYEVEAVSYLLKPIKKEQLIACLNRARERSGKKPEKLLVESGDELWRVKYADICALESEGHDTLLYRWGEKEPLRSKKGIHGLETELMERSELFFKPHRSYLVNLAWIKRIGKKELELESGMQVPIARGKWEELNLAYLAYCRKGDQ